MDPEPPESRALRECSHLLTDLIQHDCHNIATKLLSSGLISEEVESRTRLNSSETEVANALLASVRSAVRVSPRLCSVFISDVLEGTFYEGVRNALETKLHTGGKGIADVA